MHFWDSLTDIGILLTASLLVGGIAARFGLNPLIGYLLAGMFFGGPGSVNLIRSSNEIGVISELGVSLLLFSLGLEFSWEKVKSFSISIVKSGISQIILTLVFISVIAYLFGIGYKLAILLGLIITLSSTATVLRTLTDSGEIDSSHGRNSIAALLLQDIAVVPFTLIISFLASSNENFGHSLWVTLWGSVALVSVLYLFLTKLAGPIFKLFTLEANREIAILLAIITSVGSAWIAHHIGISSAIGAFIAGMALGSSPFATQIRVDVSPLKVIFLTLFFTTAGMLANPIWIMKNFTFVLLLTISTMLFKTGLAFIAFKVCKNTVASAIASALCLSQIGEFAFVLSNIAAEAKILPAALHQIIISVTIFSIFLTPFVINIAPAIGLFIQKIFFKKDNLDSTPTLNAKREAIYLLGYGPAGTEVARQLRDFDYPIIVIDLNQDCLANAEEDGFEAHLGDVRQLELLQHYGMANAVLVIITIPSRESALAAIDNIRSLNENTKIIVRSRYQAHVDGFERTGANLVVNEEFAVGQKLGEAAMQFLPNS